MKQIGAGDEMITPTIVAAPTARQRLAAITDPLSRAVLDLHYEDEKYHECRGCDFDGYEAEPPQWPCRTIEKIAEHHGIDMTGVA